jgi:N-acetylglucosamine malate deacetylase 1
MKAKKILVVAAHPDDEVLGCGGTIVKHAIAGDSVHLLILGEGITSRFTKRESGLGSKELDDLKRYINQSSKIMKIKNTHVFTLPDNRFDSVELLDIVKIVEKAKKEIRPDVIYTHHRADLNIDHRITFEAVLTACRPLQGETVKEIYSFEIPSSTEWSYPNSFQPNIYVDISGTIKTKIAAMKAYKSEIRKWPHPRSEEAILTLAKKRGCEAGLDFAESFELVRLIK